MVNILENARLKAMLKNLPIHPTQAQAVLGVKIVVILAAAVVLFSQDLLMMFNDALQSDTTSYMIVIPFILGYVIYRKRKMLKVTTALKTSEPRNQKRLLLIAGVLLSASAIMLYWYGSYTFTPLEYHLLALPLFVSGLVLIMFNPQTLRQLAFAIALLVFFAPPPGEILYDFGATLSVVSAVVSNGIVSVLGVPSAVSSEFGSPAITITRPDGTPMNFGVDITCSGIYSLIGFLVFALFVVYIVRDKPWKRGALLLVGFPLVYLLNIIRITSILLIGYQFGEDLALNVFHLLGGWVLIFLGTLFLLFISEKIFKTQIFTKPAEKCPECNLQPSSKGDFCPKCGRITHTSELKLSKSDVVKIAAIIMSVALVISIQAPVFALTQNLAIDINTPYGQPVSIKILPNIPGYNFTYQQPAPQKFLERSNEDLATSFLFTGTTKEPLWITIEISSTLSNLHTWEECLITYPISHGLQLTIRQIDLKDVSLNDNPPIIGRVFVFQYLATNQTQAVLSWYESATFRVNSTSQQKYMKISVEAFPRNTQNLQPLEDQMLFVAKTVANYWQPIKTWSQIALTLSQNGDKLVLVTLVLLLGTVVILLIDKRRKRKKNFYALQKISDSNKKFINAINETEETTIPTLSNIARTYRSTCGTSIQQSELLQELRHAEEAGFIESNVTNKNDEPLQTWKTQIAFQTRSNWVKGAASQ